MKAIKRFGWLVVCVTLWAGVGAAQCALCKTTAEASGNAQLMQGLNLGILVLLVPPLAIFCGLFWAVTRQSRTESSPQMNADKHR